jgi:hypothetical protein
MLALASLEQTDLLTALPLSLARTHATRFSAAWVRAPLPIRNYALQNVTSRAALQDAGVAWLFEALVAATRSAAAARARRPKLRRARSGNGT